MKPLIQCEEWTKLRVGQDSTFKTYDELKAVVDAWKRSTRKSPIGYFDFQTDFLMPKFWSGTLDTPNFTFEVLPIGTTSLNQEMRVRLDSSISVMLAAATSAQSMTAGTAYLNDKGNRYDAVLSVFCEELKLARRRQVLRRYRSAAGSHHSPKGRISFPGQCYEGLRNPGRILSQWVELTEDIPENRVFKAVLLRYRPRCSAIIRARIDQSLSELDAVTPSEHHLEWPRIRTDKLPDIYHSLLAQSRALLDDEGVGVFSGEKLANSEIIFTSRLFEHFMAKEIGEIAAGMGLKANAQERGNFICEKENGQLSFEIIPDLRIVDKHGGTFCIVDTKWKFLRDDVKDLGILRDDIYQILIYALKHQCRDVVILYPDVSENSGMLGYYEKRKACFGGFDCNIHIAKVPLLAPTMLASRSYLKQLLSGFKSQNIASITYY